MITFKRKIQKTIQFLDVIEEETLKYVLIQIFFPNTKDKFKLRIDNLTYDRFKALFKLKPFKSVYEKYEYIFWGMIKEQNDKRTIFYIYVLIKSGNKKYKSKLRCSKTFAQNMAWMSEVYEFNEYYKYLEKV